MKDWMILVRNITLFCLMICAWSTLAVFPMPDYQLLHYEKFTKHTKAKLILVRNDTWQAVEVSRADVGSLLICITREGVIVSRPVSRKLFSKQDYRFVRCRLGKFYYASATV